MFRKLTLLVVIAGGSSAMAQPDPAGGVVFMGWSKSGHLALRSYSESFGIDHSCAFEATIVNVVTDEVVWKYRLDWNEAGPNAPPCPGARGAWKKARSEVEAALAKFEIKGPESGAVKRFPAGSIEFSVEVKKETYEVTATSEALGSKVISRGTVVDWDEDGNGAPSVLGWVASPDKNRIAVITKQPCFPQQPCPIPAVIGCHVKAGFKK